MVKGIERFREYFSDFTEQYVLIGGAACDISFGNSNADFRVTKDLDIVLVVEAITKEFGIRFWDFIRDGGYRNRAKSNGNPQFYRFDKPEQSGFPSMIELFARTDYILEDDAMHIPLHIDNEVSSLSAILLNDSYYQALLDGRDIIDGISVLRPVWLIPFKAKAWLDLKKKRQEGVEIHSQDIKKHRNDIIRIASEMVLERCELSGIIREDMQNFIDEMELTDKDLNDLGIRGVSAEDVRQVLVDNYL